VSHESYPEHEKLHAVVDASQAIGEFLDLGRWTLCEIVEPDDDGWSSSYYRPVNIQDALAEYFGIDRAAIEREKRAMLAAMREAAK
jgi:hypothetical protein